MAQQIITTEELLSVISGQDLATIVVEYSTEDPLNSPARGLGFKLHYDSSQLQFEDFSDVFTFGAQPQDFTQLAPQDDRNDLDNNPQTDQVISFLYADPDVFSNPSATLDWPLADNNIDSLPVSLFAVNFDSSNLETETVVNFTLSQVQEGFDNQRNEILSTTTVVPDNSNQPRQLVIPELTTPTVQANQDFEVNLAYEIENLNPEITARGLNFRLHYNSEQVAFQELTTVFDFGGQGLEETQDQEDTQDFDGDSSTDRILTFLYSDPQIFSNPNAELNWPLNESNTTAEDLPLDLVTVNFEALGRFDRSTLNLTLAQVQEGFDNQRNEILSTTTIIPDNSNQPRQLVIPELTTPTVQANQDFEVNLAYDIENLNPEITARGLNFRLHYNSEQVAFQELTTVFDFGGQGLEETQDQEDTQDFDGDSSTDRILTFLYSDPQIFSNPNAELNWPLNESNTTAEDLPLDLVTVNFEALGRFDRSTLNLTLAQVQEGFDNQRNELVNSLEIEAVLGNPPIVENFLDNITLTQGELPDPINLFDTFEDTEDDDANLTYTVVENTNSELVETALDTESGELNLIPATAAGSSEITIEATDSQGLRVRETFTLTINRQNGKPSINAPLNEITLTQGENLDPINLFDTFQDDQDTDEELKLTANSSNKNLVRTALDSNTGRLFLQFPSTRTGSSEITVSAVDSSGLTTTETFTVTVNPSGEAISLEENNDTLETASTPQLSPDTPNLNLAGEIGDNNFGDQDIDLYRLELQKGDQLTADINTDDNSSFDSFLRLFDSFGQEVERNDDSQQGENDSLLEFSADTSQTYYIGVSGFGNDQYNPNLENSGSKGDTGSYNLALTLTSTASETPNDTISQAIATSALIQENGQFQQPGFLGDNSTLNNPNLDVDFYEIQLTQGETATIDIDTTENSPLNPILRIFNATGGNVPNGFNDNAKAPGEQLGNDPYLEFTAPFSGSYYVGVSDQANDLYSPYNPESGQSPGATGAYAINITQDVSREDSPPEASPNDTLDTATALLVGDEIQGNIGDRTEFVTVPGLDVDVYTLTLEADQAIRINLNRTSQLDPILRFFNSEGEEIAFNDDIGSSDNALLELTIPETGDYYIGVSGFGNENYDVTTAGSGKSFASTGSYQLIISDQQPEILEAGEEEENDTLDTATATSLTADSLGSLKQTNAIGNNPNLEEAGLDVDIFQVELDTNTRLTAEINTENFNSEFDSLLRVFNSEGEQLDFNDDESSDSLDSQLEFIPTVAGTYYVGVSGLGNENYNPKTVSSGNAGRIGDYEIELRLNEVTPQENPTNETPETASQVNLTNNRFSTNGVIGDNTNVEVDRDFYEIDLEQGSILNIRVNGDNLESFVRLFNSKDEEIPLEYEAGDFPHPSLNLTIPEDDTYFLQISAFDNNEDGIPDDSIGDYRLNLAVAPPPLAAQPPVEEIRPTANNDRFRAASQRTAIFNVLGNDSANDDQGFLEITDFTATTEKGGTVELDNQSRLRYTPNPDFGGVDTFTYTVANESGGFDQGTVEVNVNRPPEGASVQVELDVRSVPGKEDQLNDGLQIGEEFIVDVRFLDRVNSENPSQAVRSGYADLRFNPNQSQVVTDTDIDNDQITDGIIRYPEYPGGRKGTVRNAEGLVDEVGGFSISQDPPEAENRIFSLHLQAIGGGNTALFASEAGQQIGSAITLFDTFITDQRNQTNFPEIDIATVTNSETVESAFPVNLANNNVIEQGEISGVQGIIEAMQVNIDFQDLAGNSLEDVAVGEEFKIVLSAEDLRPDGQQLGVFSVFADVFYDTVLIDVTEAELVGDFASPVLELPTAVEQGSGEGLIDELGGTKENFNPVRSGSQTFAELTVTAKAPGQLDVSTNAPEGKTAKNTLFGVDVEVTEGTVYSEKRLDILGETEEGNPDLVITEFDAVVDHVLGGETEVNLTVENQGDGTSPGFQVEILYYTADDLGELEEEEPMVVKTLAFEELTESRSETAAVSLPVEVMLAEALEDDPSVFGETVPDEGFFESNNIDYLGVRLVNSESSGETTEEFTNNGVDGTEGVNVDDIAYFPWDVVNNNGDGVIAGEEDDLISDRQVTPVDANFVFENIGEVITDEVVESQQVGTEGLDLSRIDLDLDGAISPVDAVRVGNRVNYQLNSAINDDVVG
ncbi:pre-peptidase C-terminal domain-containing protein [Dactylococcopsis salina]|uniref:Pre-peptidase n=1 Tax=Dactylococcopsis salina (strain PCC 8305) TaxID=13035 RepID=K9YWB0_DACS8|nr:pre-peptidase C-terminal domain-containing protein [Dactylococcopsis salina]AFZ50797.1 putative pre-peptidase [Dactylococcopsis salina PCC 8305]